MEADSCFLCGEAFEKRKKGFKRRRVMSFTSPRSVKKLVPSIDETTDMNSHFMCDSCVASLKKNSVMVPKRGKLKRWTVLSPTRR